MAGLPPPATIYALSSGRPPAAIAVIRISGGLAHSAASMLCGTLPQPRQASVRALRSTHNDELLDEALVLRFDGPHSATGEDLVEFHCHGSRAVVDAVLKALGGLDGLREADPGEFTRRAFHNGRIDLTEAEGLADLLEAETDLQRRSALLLAEGGLRNKIEEWRLRILELSARAELAIDYVDDEDGQSPPDIATPSIALSSEIEAWLLRPRIEALREGVRVVIAGPPNIGKSSLLNILVGHDRSIVADEEGTTRDSVDVPLSIEGVPLLLTDTAGLRATADVAEAEGVRRANALVQGADILLWMGDKADSPEHENIIALRPKADLTAEDDERLAISSKTGEGIAALLQIIKDRASSMVPAEGVIALNNRQAQLLEEAKFGLSQASNQDVAVAADGLRRARVALDMITGRAAFDDFLDTLFSRFCLGK